MTVFNRKELSEALAILKKVADKKSSVQILKNVLVEYDGNRATLTTSDIDSYASCHMPVEKAEKGSFCVNVFDLADAIKAKVNDVEIKEIGEKIEIRCGGVSTLPTLPTDYFPCTNAIVNCDFQGTSGVSELKSALEYALASVSDDFTRPHINGILFADDGSLVSTDGHRLHQTKKAVYWEKKNAPVLLQSKPLSVLAQIIGKQKNPLSAIKFSKLANKHVRMVIGNYAIESKLIEANFPPYEQVIPNKRDKKIAIARSADLESAIKGVMGKEKGIKLVIENEKLDIFYEDVANEIKRSCHVDFTRSTVENLTIGFNAAYLLDAIKGAYRADLYLDGQLDPLRIESENGTAVVMPMPRMNGN